MDRHRRHDLHFGTVHRRIHGRFELYGEGNFGGRYDEIGVGIGNDTGRPCGERLDIADEQNASGGSDTAIHGYRYGDI